MKRLKKILIVAGTSLLLVMLAACGGGSSASNDSSGSKKITIWAWDETFNIKAVEEAKKIYKEKDKDVKVEVVTMSQDDIVQKLNTSLASGNTDGLPNIVLIEDYRIQGYLTSYPDAFADLSNIVNEDDFSDYKFAVNKVGSKIYGVPFDSGVAGLFYRTDYLEQAGYTAKDLQNITWDQYIAIGKDVKNKTGHALLSINPSDLGLIRIMMQSAGEWYTAKDGETVTVSNNEALKEGMKVFAELINSGVATQVSDWDGGVNAVQSGDVASSPTGSWYSSTIMGAADQSGKWAIAPIPTLADNSKSIPASSIGGGGWYVIKGVGNTKLAKDFLKQTFATSSDLMDTLANKIGLISTLKSAASTDAYKAKSEFYGGQQVFKDLSEWSAEVPSVNYGLHTYAIESILTEYAQKIIDGADIDTVLKDAQTQIESSIAN